MRPRSLSLLLSFLVLQLLHAQDRTAPGLVHQRIAEARSAGMIFLDHAPWTVVPQSRETQALWSASVSQATVLQVDMEATAMLTATAPAYLTLQLPVPGGVLHLDLERRDIFQGAPLITTSSGRMLDTPPSTAHYQGVVRGDDLSVVAVSIQPDGFMGLIADAQGQWVLGPFEDGPAGMHVLYSDRDLRARPDHACGTPDLPEQEMPADVDETLLGADRTIRCVSYYWEVAHDLYLNKGSTVNTVDYVTGLFNQSALLFANDGIDITLSEVFVWDTPSPYDATNSLGRLNQFGQTRTSFNGDMAHLLDLGNYGGIAYLNTLCAGGTSLRMAYSGINASYNNVPTYSWSVMVVTHEAGHNLGSQHTHACAWNGDNTAIDGCGPAAGYTEGSCAQAPVPPSNVGGTIMSYCHLVSAGINLANGFGPQPAVRMRDRVNIATCLAMCGTSCDPPANLNATQITTTSALITWGNIGADSYTLQWREAGGTWATITGLTGTSHPLTGLTHSTAYEYRMSAVCGTDESPLSTTRTFNTAVPCPDALEPNNTVATAALVELPALFQATIATAEDVDHYRFILAEQSTVNLSLYNLVADYDLFLLDAGGAVVASSTNGGTWSEFIQMQGLAAGTYHARVVGWNGAFSPDMCYTLNITSWPSTGCDPPDVVSATSITHNSALVAWSLTEAASYDVRRRVIGTQQWMTTFGIIMPPHELMGLTPSTIYEVQIRSNCEGEGQGGIGGNPLSLWSASHEFTTQPEPCVAVLLKAWLEGPFAIVPQTMTDHLRSAGLIPLQEPYTALGWVLSQTASTSPSVLAVTGDDAIVDWVVVELRDAGTPSQVIASKAALIQRDGEVVDVDGLSQVVFCVPAGPYHVALRHRNHLGCMTGSAVSLGPLGTIIDLRLPATTTHGSQARKAIGSMMALWAGNAVDDNVLKYSGASNDRDPILTAIGGNVPTATVPGYLGADVNMDGVVKYSGPANDRDPILVNIGGTVPTATRTEQLP